MPQVTLGEGKMLSQAKEKVSWDTGHKELHRSVESSVAGTVPLGGLCLQCYSVSPLKATQQMVAE